MSEIKLKGHVFFIYNFGWHFIQLDITYPLKTRKRDGGLLNITIDKIC